MVTPSARSASSAPARWATASPMSARSPAIDVAAQRRRRRAHRRGHRHDQRQHGAPGQPPADHRRGAQGGARAHHAGDRRSTDLADCDLVIEAATENEERQAQDLHRALRRRSSPSAIARHQHLVDLDHAAGRRHRPAGALHRHPFHEPGAADGAGRAHPRHRHRRRRPSRRPRQFVSKLGKTIAVSEDFPAFIVNRILLPMINEAIYTLYEGVGTVEAIDTAMRLGAHHPMGPLRARRFHRPRHLPVGHAGAVRGPGGFQIPALPAAGEIRRGRLARPQDPARLLRLSRRKARSDAINWPRLAWSIALARATYFHNDDARHCRERSVAALLSATAGQ